MPRGADAVRDGRAYRFRRGDRRRFAWRGRRSPGQLDRLRRQRSGARRDRAARGQAADLARDRHARGGRPWRASRSGAGRASPSSRPATRSSRRAPRSRPGAVYDTNAAAIAAAVEELGGEPVPLGIVPDDEAALELTLRQALEQADLVILSGGTSKGAGDVSYRAVARLGEPGILVHGVALKPGKPLCLAVDRRQAGRRAAGLSDLGHVHLPGVRRRP